MCVRKREKERYPAEMEGQGNEQSVWADNAIRAVQNKKMLPEIDFTLHTMEDGTKVSAQERVCKGVTSSR